jgi:hypothetical protein
MYLFFGWIRGPRCYFSAGYHCRSSKKAMFLVRVRAVGTNDGLTGRVDLVDWSQRISRNEHKAGRLTPVHLPAEKADRHWTTMDRPWSTKAADSPRLVHLRTSAGGLKVYIRK